MERVDAFKAIIGEKNQDYYLSYFRRCEERGYAPPSWNWPALFLGVFWLLWRRQYRWAGFTMLLGVGTSIVSSLVAEKTGSPNTADLVAFLLGFPYLGIYLPLKANGIYYQWCSQMIADAKNQATDPEKNQDQKAWLESRGGVNQALPLYLLLAFVLLTLLGSPPPELANQ